MCENVKKMDAWNEDIFDYVIPAISGRYGYNIHVHNMKDLGNGGYEITNDSPIITSANLSEGEDIHIHLRRLNDNHYDLMKEKV